MEGLDIILDGIAANSTFSSVDLRQQVKAKYAEPMQTDEALSKIFRKLPSSEAKWMIRMLMKTYSPVQVPEILAMQQFHFLLPDLLKFQNSLNAAVQVLSSPTMKSMPAQPTKDQETELRALAFRELRPQAGTMITRPLYEKREASNIAVSWQVQGFSALNRSMMVNTVKSMLT